jgi:hypothetical protein
MTCGSPALVGSSTFEQLSEENRSWVASRGTGRWRALVMMPVVKAAGVLFHRRAKTWKVGVLRVRDRKIGGRVKVLHKESLEVGDDLLVRIDVLANDVRNGRFDNT